VEPRYIRFPEFVGGRADGRAVPAHAWDRAYLSTAYPIDPPSLRPRKQEPYATEDYLMQTLLFRDANIVVRAMVAVGLRHNSGKALAEAVLRRAGLIDTAEAER
jgi:hypothetical protein